MNRCRFDVQWNTITNNEMKAVQDFNESSVVICDNDNQKQTGGRAGDREDVEILFESDRMDRSWNNDIRRTREK